MLENAEKCAFGDARLYAFSSQVVEQSASHDQCMVTGWIKCRRLQWPLQTCRVSDRFGKVVLRRAMYIHTCMLCAAICHGK